MDPRTTVFALGPLLAAAAVVGFALRRASRLQRRLFLLFVLLSWLPALGVVSAQWYLARRPLALLESPGLRESQESSLELARWILDAEERAALRRAKEVAISPRPQPRSEESIWIVDGDGEWTLVAGRALSGAIPAAGQVERRRIEGRTVHIAVAWVDSMASRRCVVGIPLSAELDALLARVAEGSTRSRQLAFFYSELLRADMLWSLLVLSALILLGSLLLSRQLADRVGAPIRDLAQGTRRVAAGELGHRVRASGVDELAELVDSFNRMTEQLEDSNARLVRTERLAAWQSIARRLAHEIKNPLTPIHLALHRMRKRIDEPDLLEGLDTILEETANLQRLADEFSLYARLPEPKLRPVSMRAVLESVVELYGRHAPSRIEWGAWPDADVVRADEGQMRQLLGNVVKNGFEAMGDRGVIRLSAADEGLQLRVDIEDDGPGLPGEPESIFAVDFTTKSSGTGLGLAIARKIAEDHRGSLTASSASGGGARFSLRIPKFEHSESAT